MTQHTRPSFFRYIIPALLTVLLFLIVTFWLILPTFKESHIESKRQMIRQLAQSAQSILRYYNGEELAGRMTKEDAQEKAIAEIRAIRFGPEDKDYLWINDLHPRVVMHPYRTDLEGRDVSAFSDPHGKHLFVEAVKTVKASKSGEGFVDYYWQWKDNPDLIVAKLSFVKLFEPWGWIVGTGVYLDDVEDESASMIKSITMISLGIVVVITLFSLSLARAGYLSEHKRLNAEEALHNSEKRFQALTDIMTEGLAAQDEQGCFTFVNDRFCEMLGYHRSELLGQKVGMFIDPENQEFYELQIKLRRQQKQQTYEIVWQKKDGNKLYSIISPQGFYGDQGEYKGSFGVVTDISHHIEIEKALRETDQRYFAMFANMSNAVAVYDVIGDGENFVFKDFNRSAEIVDKIAKADIIGKPVTQVFPQIKKFGLFDVFQRVWKTGNPERFAQTFYNDSRIVGWRDNYVYKLPAGEIVAIYNDITEMKLAEERLRQSEWKFRELTDSITDAFCAIDNEMRFTYWNKAMEKMTGVSEKQVLGKEILEQFPIAKQRIAFERIEAALASKKPDLFEDTITVEGRQFHFEIVAYPSRDGLSILARDITDRKNLEDERLLLETHLQQSQKLEAIGRLAGGIAHDFNNLLAGIVGNIDLAMQECSGESSEFLDNALNAASRATALVKQLLVFSRRGIATYAPTKLETVVQQAIRMLRETIDRRIDLPYELPSEPCLVFGDSNQIHQILLNLYINSRDAILDQLNLPDRTDLFDERPIYRIVTRLKKATLDDKQARVHPQARPGEYVVIEVCDNGPGMDDETRNRVFEPFFTTKEQGRGTGLGLATVYGITQQHKGWIEVESEPGKGATFRIYLPAYHGELDANGVVSEKDEIPGGDETILIVDDEPLIRRMARHILQIKGYKVLQAEEGKSALELFDKQKEQIHLVLLDQTMPIMTGMEVLQRLRAIAPQVRVLMSSGYTEPEQLEQFKQFGAMGFIPKPYKIDALTRAIRDILDGKQVFDA